MNMNKDTGYIDPNKKTGDKRYPFDKGKKQMKENIVDPKSELVYEEKRWKKVDEVSPRLVDTLKTAESPVTKMQNAKICDGVLHLTGTFIKDHKEEILNTMKNSGTLAQERDSMNIIERIENPSEEHIIVYTLKNQLAVKLGKKVDQSFKGGKLDISWSKEDQPVEVKWHKDL
jgi:hypothetical protein